MFHRLSIGLLSAALLSACGTVAPQPVAVKKTIVIPPGRQAEYDRFHYAPVVRVGDTLILSGIPAYGANTYEGKIRHMFEDVKGTLEAAGATLADVVEITTFHQDATDTETFQKEFAEFLKVHKEYFKENYPAWTAVGTTALLAKGAPVEMRVVAVVGAGK